MDTNIDCEWDPDLEQFKNYLEKNSSKTIINDMKKICLEQLVMINDPDNNMSNEELLIARKKQKENIKYCDEMLEIEDKK